MTNARTRLNGLRWHTLAAVTAALLTSIPGPAYAQVETSPPDTRFSTTIESPDQLAERLDRILDDPALTRAHVGMAVQVAETGEVLFEKAAEKLFIPASNVKVVTAAVALDVLGPAYRWSTLLMADGPIQAGVLEGDLWIVGSGDPWLTRSEVDAWPAVLADAGIRRIDGDVIGDDRVFTSPQWGQGWFWHELHAAWAAGVSGLQLRPNTVRARLIAAPEVGAPAALQLVADGPALHIESRVRTGAPGSGIRLHFEPPPEGGPVELVGWIPALDTVPLNLATHHPTLYLLAYLEDRLAAAGIEVNGAVRRAGAEDGRRRVTWSHEVGSDSLGAVIAEMLKPSDNQVSESVLRTIGAEQVGEGSPEAGLGAIRGVLNRWGIEPGAMELSDGSGLSRYNRIAPNAMARLLRTMWQHDHFEVFLAGMPVAAVDGTLSRRLAGTPGEDNVQAKTGSLSSARSLSGYLTAGGGETLVFSLMINGYDVPGAVAVSLEDLLVEQLALYRRPVEAGWPAFREDGP